MTSQTNESFVISEVEVMNCVYEFVVAYGELGAPPPAPTHLSVNQTHLWDGMSALTEWVRDAQADGVAVETLWGFAVYILTQGGILSPPVTSHPLSAPLTFHFARVFGVPATDLR